MRCVDIIYSCNIHIFNIFAQFLACLGNHYISIITKNDIHLHAIEIYVYTFYRDSHTDIHTHTNTHSLAECVAPEQEHTLVMSHQSRLSPSETCN